MLSGRKILVTGPTGNLTFPIVRALAKNNEVYGLARFSKPEDRQRLEALGVKCIKKDLATDPLDDLPPDLEYVFHAGAMVAMGSEKDMAYTFEVNAQGTGRLMYQCRRVKTFVHCSTGSVYKHQGHKPIKETDPFGVNIAAYSLSKIAAESVVKFASSTWNIPTITLRIGTFFGPDGGGPSVRFDRMVRGKEIWVHPDKPNDFGLIWEDDAVELAIKAMTLGQAPPLVTNFGGNEPVSIEDYCAYAGKLLGIEPKFKYTEEAYPGHFMDPTFMHQVLGRCKTPWKVGIRRILEKRYPHIPLREVPD